MACHQRRGPLKLSASKPVANEIRKGQGSSREHVSDLCVLLRTWKTICLKAWDAPHKLFELTDNLDDAAAKTESCQKSNTNRAQVTLALSGRTKAAVRRTVQEQFPDDKLPKTTTTTTQKRKRVPTAAVNAGQEAEARSLLSKLGPSQFQAGELLRSGFRLCFSC